MATIDIRCPNNPSRLFIRLKQEGIQPHITDSNLLEVACSDCRREYRKRGDSVFRVLHRYDMVGSLVETIVVRE